MAGSIRDGHGTGSIVDALTFAELRRVYRTRQWRRYEAGLLADKAAWWANQAEMESDPTKHDERRNTALMFAAAAQAMKAQV